MSETFSLWHGWRSSERTVHCYVTAINLQELGAGTRQLVEMIFEDLGLSTAGDVAWSVGEPFSVSFLSSDPTDDWRDTWLLTWELAVTGDAVPDLPLQPVDLSVWDDSWEGDESTPTAFEVIATGGAARPELSRVDGVTTHICSWGHLHVRVSVVSPDVDAAAKRAVALQEHCRSAGWAVELRTAEL